MASTRMTNALTLAIEKGNFLLLETSEGHCVATSTFDIVSEGRPRAITCTANPTEYDTRTHWRMFKDPATNWLAFQNRATLGWLVAFPLPEVGNQGTVSILESKFADSPFAHEECLWSIDVAKAPEDAKGKAFDKIALRSGFSSSSGSSHTYFSCAMHGPVPDSYTELVPNVEDLHHECLWLPRYLPDNAADRVDFCMISGSRFTFVTASTIPTIATADITSYFHGRLDLVYNDVQVSSDMDGGVQALASGPSGTDLAVSTRRPTSIVCTPSNAGGNSRILDLASSGLPKPIKSLSYGPSAGLFVVTVARALYRLPDLQNPGNGALIAYEDNSKREVEQVTCAKEAYSGAKGMYNVCAVLYNDSSVGYWHAFADSTSDDRHTSESKYALIHRPIRDCMMQLALATLDTGMTLLFGLSRTGMLYVTNGEEDGPEWREMKWELDSMHNTRGVFFTNMAVDRRYIILVLSPQSVAIGRVSTDTLSLTTEVIPATLTLQAGGQETPLFPWLIVLLVAFVAVQAVQIAVQIKKLDEALSSDIPGQPPDVPPPQPRPSHRKALIIRYNTGNGMGIHDVAKELAEHQGFKWDDIEMLYYYQDPVQGSTSTQRVKAYDALPPTVTNVKDAFKRLVKDCGPEDVRVFYIDCHGTRDDLNPWSDPGETGGDTHNECIKVSSDDEKGSYLIADDWFADAVVAANMDPHANLTIIAVSCMGGGLLDLHRLSNHRAVLLAACSETQINIKTSWISTDPFTTAMLEALEGQRAIGDPPFTYLSLLHDIMRRIEIKMGLPAAQRRAAGIADGYLGRSPNAQMPEPWNSSNMSSHQDPQLINNPGEIANWTFLQPWPTAA